MHGDITTRGGVNSKNIVAKVGNEVRAYATSNHYKASDFKQIIHIVDTKLRKYMGSSVQGVLHVLQLRLRSV